MCSRRIADAAWIVASSVQIANSLVYYIFEYKMWDVLTENCTCKLKIPHLIRFVWFSSWISLEFNRCRIATRTIILCHSKQNIFLCTLYTLICYLMHRICKISYIYIYIQVSWSKVAHLFFHLYRNLISDFSLFMLL